MAKEKLTPWFPASVNPVHVGLYQRKYKMQHNIELPDFWDGRIWFLCDKDGSSIARANEKLPWRGLVKP